MKLEAGSTQLVRYDALCQAIAAAKTVVELHDIHAKAAALRDYARQAKNRSLEIDAAEIRIRAERRVGELVELQSATVGLSEGGRPKKTGVKFDPVSKPATLAEAGIDKYLARRARQFAALTNTQFEVLIVEWREQIEAEHERLTTNLFRQRPTRRPTPPLPPGLFRVLCADPPWQYEHIETESRAIENQYPTMLLEEICELPVPAADDAVLFLWATSPKLTEALQVIKAWGFVYRTCAVWDKEIIGMGYYFRQQHELLLVAAKGHAPVPSPADRPASVLRMKRDGHSIKPDRVYAWIERMYPDYTERERLELFARRPRAGWSVWGTEVEQDVCGVLAE